MPDEVANLGILDKTVKEGVIVPSIWRLEIGSVLLCAERAKPYSKSTPSSNLYFKGYLHQN
nr:toxin of toxin-antitoxin system [Rickettsia helvetica]